jgi:hypothetical protein
VKRDRIRRRVLYGSTVWAWLIVGHFASMSVKLPDDSTQRTWLVVTLAIASCLFTSSLLVCMLPSQDRAYRSGFNDGKQVSGCLAYRPPLSMVVNERHSNVTPIRSSHSDN